MNQSIFYRAELKFWDFAIQLLSEDGQVRVFLRKISRLATLSEMTSLGVLMAVTGLAGLVSGYVFYFISTGLR